MPELDVGNENPRLERIRIQTFGFLLRVAIDSISLPVLILRDRHRFKIWIPTSSRRDGKKRTPWCRMCVYTPTEVDPSWKEPRGVVVHLHGGGWTISRPETEAPICRYLSDNLNVVVVAPDYCKAPLHPYPYAVEQQYAVLSWIANGGLAEALTSHKFTLPIDPSRIALSGGSSGSNLCASLTLLTITRPLPTPPSSQSPPRPTLSPAHIAAVGLLYPVLNLAVPHKEKMSKVDPYRGLPPSLSRFFIHAYLPPPRSATDPHVSPALAPPEQLALFPPTVILTAAYDYLANEADEFAESLRSQGVRVRNHRFADVGHAFDGIPTWDKQQRMLNHQARDEAWGMIVEQFQEVLL